MGSFFSLSLLLLKDPFLISFSASRHSKKQPPCPFPFLWKVRNEVDSIPPLGLWEEKREPSHSSLHWLLSLGRECAQEPGDRKGFPCVRAKICQRPGGSPVILQSLPEAHYSSPIPGSWRYCSVLLVSVAAAVGGSSEQTRHSPGPALTSCPFAQGVLFLNVNRVSRNDSRD